MEHRVRSRRSPRIKRRIRIKGKIKRSTNGNIKSVRRSANKNVNSPAKIRKARKVAPQVITHKMVQRTTRRKALRTGIVPAAEPCTQIARRQRMLRRKISIISRRKTSSAC